MRDRLQEAAAEHDVVVVGGGINGAGVARDAALRGYRVALVEKDDLASGTSSRTSKLVHGGVRYLEQGALGLVREACAERRRLLRLAPHLVRPLPFVFPVYRDSRFGPVRLRLGMWLYDLLAAFRNVERHRMLPLQGGAGWCEGLSAVGLRGAALYWDAAMDDARLVVATALGAVRAGAVVLPRVECVELVRDDAAVTGVVVRDSETGRTACWRARVVIACTGPWTNAFLARLPAAPRPLATTRGTHIVVRRLAERAFTLAAGRDGRVFFVLPWLGLTLVGTTDVDDESPDGVAPTEAEIEYLIAETNRHFPAARLARTEVLAAFAGVRPLLTARASASTRSREHAVLEPLPGLLAVVGGKYTTYRAVAEEVVDHVARRLGRRAPCCTARKPLPGGDLAWSPEEHWREGALFAAHAAELAATAGVDTRTASRWLGRYGTLAGEVAALAACDPSLAVPLCAHDPTTRAEVLHAIRTEMALRLEDFFLRRSGVAFAAPCHGLDALEAAASVFAAELGWDGARRQREVDSCAMVLRKIGASGGPDAC